MPIFPTLEFPTIFLYLWSPRLSVCRAASLLVNYNTFFPYNIFLDVIYLYILPRIVNKAHSLFLILRTYREFLLFIIYLHQQTHIY
jgi:hypothetical protein